MDRTYGAVFILWDVPLAGRLECFEGGFAGATGKGVTERIQTVVRSGHRSFVWRVFGLCHLCHLGFALGRFKFFRDPCSLDPAP